MTFTLDTSGFVIVNGLPIRWDAAAHDASGTGLTPFTQGYIEALIQGIEWPDPAEGFGPSSSVVRFSDLAPETLARIMEDCAGHGGSTARDGQRFWGLRQLGDWAPAFPPLTHYLGDDGRVYLREPSQ